MKKRVTLKELTENEELFDCVLRKILFYYIIEHPEEHERLNKLSMKRLHKPLEFRIPKNALKYRITIEEWKKAKVF